jgi:hypothetical protein
MRVYEGRVAEKDERDPEWGRVLLDGHGIRQKTDAQAGNSIEILWAPNTVFCIEAVLYFLYFTDCAGFEKSQMRCCAALQFFAIYTPYPILQSEN